MMENDFEYYAFISYSHKDEAWAKWIQEAIERYRLPAIIRKEAKKPLPKKIQPVFLDQTDLGVGKLVDNIHQELEKSRFLIVVCSPNSAQPNAEGRQFIEEEVAHFCRLGREKQIIPVIVQGTPQEAFCPKLKELDLLALDATKESKPRILNDLVATILGLRRDELWNRERRRLRLQRIRRAIIGVITGVVAMFVSLFVWDSNRTVRNYYADYVDSFGLPEGIFPLKRSELAHRYIHYRFEYKGFQRGKSPHADSADWCIWNMFGFRRRLVRVVQANSCGYPRKWVHTEYSDRPQIQDFKYDRDLRLREIRYGRYNGEGKAPHLERRIELWDEGDVKNGLIKFFADKGQLGFAYGAASATSLGTAGSSMSGKSEITQHLVQRDAKGRVTQRLFLNLSGGNVPDGDGLYGFSYEYDDLGRQTAQWYLFRDGDGFSRRANKKGVTGRRYEYAGRNIRKVEYVDSYGHSGMVRVESFDEFDNNTESWYFDEKGNKFTSADGSAGCRTEYDAFGNRMRLVCLGTDGKPTLYKDGYADERSEYDARGNVTKTSYYGVDGKPTLRKGGYAEIRNEYDERGNETMTSYYGVDGKPTLRNDGIAEVRREYDVRGNPMRESYFGVDSKPTLGKDGVAEVRGKFDVRGNQTRWSCFGVDGKPTLSKDGFAEVRQEYDVRGNGTRMSFFGVDGNPTLLKEGIAGWMVEYDEHGNKTRVSYFGVDGKPTLLKGGYAEKRMEYDTRGNQTRESYFGLDGKLMLNGDGIAGWMAEYNARGNVTRVSYFGVDGKPMLNGDGISGWMAKYDAHGNMTRESYFGMDGKPVLRKNGIAGWMAEYDARGRETRNVWIGVDGNPMLTKDGYAECRKEYDARGNVTKESYMGVDGKLTLDKYGIASWVAEYDARENKTKTSYFGVDGKPTLDKYGIASWMAEYNARGNKTRVSYFGVDGKPTLRNDGIAEVRREYDVRGNQTRESYFGVDGKPTLMKNGYAEYRMEYDGSGNVTRMSCFDIDGKPTSNKDGYAEVRFTRKPDGSVATAQCFDVSGNAITLRLVVVSAEVTTNLAAEKAGVKEGDIWCRLGEYDILKSEKAEYVREAMKAARIARNTEKELVVARKIGDAYEILSFKFPVGIMGISIDMRNIPDFDKLSQAYRTYCKKEKQEGEKK